MSSFAAAAFSMRASQPGADLTELVNALADLTFPGEAGKRSEKSAKLAQELKEVTAKSYNMSVAGGSGRLDIVDKQDGEIT